jgi:hypothetical protein
MTNGDFRPVHLSSITPIQQCFSHMSHQTIHHTRPPNQFLGSLGLAPLFLTQYYIGPIEYWGPIKNKIACVSQRKNKIACAARSLKKKEIKERERSRGPEARLPDVCPERSQPVGPWGRRVLWFGADLARLRRGSPKSRATSSRFARRSRQF